MLVGTVMSKSLADIKARLSPETLQKANERAAELRLKIEGLQPLRVALGQTQTDIAKRTKKSQASVAKLEQRTDMLLSTLRSHIQGMGGELDLVARFPGHGEVRLSGIGDIPEPERPQNGGKQQRELQHV